MPFKLPKPKTNPDGYEREKPIEKFAERILVPEKGSVIVPLTNVVFAVIARVIDALIGKLHRVSVFAERVIVRPLHSFAGKESEKVEFGRLPGKVSGTVLLSSAAVVRMIVYLKVVRLSLAKLMDANVPNDFILNKPTKGGLPRLSDYGRNSSVATRWLVLFGRNFGARSSLTPSFATACSCSSNVSRGWKLADLLSDLFNKKVLEQLPRTGRIVRRSCLKADFDLEGLLMKLPYFVLPWLPLIFAGCEGDGGAASDVGPSTFEQVETLDRLKKELEILKWENSRLALKVIKVDGSQLVRDKNTGLWHHDVNRVPFTGRAIETHANGSPKGEASFLNGGQDGMSRFWYESGARKEESQWFDNRRHGFSRRWDESGQLIESKQFKNGELIEVFVEFR